MSRFHIPPSPPRFRVAAVYLLTLLLVGYDRAASPDKEASASPSPTAKTWTDIPAARPEDRVTIHYHRGDNQYDKAEIWTWDGYQKTTPAQNTLAALGRDGFGAVYQFNRADYGGSDKIGLITRLGHDWSHKDGGDKFWTPALGNEVWLLGGKGDVFTRQPDLSPHVEAAYLDSPDSVVVELSEQAQLPVKVSLLDQKDAVYEAQAAFPTGASGHPAGEMGANEPLRLTVTPKKPLDVVHGRFRVRVDGFGAAAPVAPRGVLENRDLFYDADARLGATYSSQSTVFRLFAPTATSVSIVLYDEAAGAKGRVAHLLQGQSKGIWEVTVEGDQQGRFYVYLLDGPGLDPKREVVDPYATNAVASSTRGRITPATPPPRPGPSVASPTDIVVYEMHVRDFTFSPSSGVRNRGLYLGFTEGNTHLPDDTAIRTAVDHLVELGVTHVQLLPVQDFENNEADATFNWGYIPTAYFSGEGMYATNANDSSRVRELKALVDALHARGIGVILDVVYNHTGNGASFPFVVPQYYYRHRADGSPENGSACGNDFRTEAPMGRKLILDSLKFWTREYGIDGYRFDLMALIDQETVRQIERELRAINPGIILFGEPWTAGASSLPDKSDKTAIRELPVGAFNDNFRNALKGSPDGRDPGFIQTGANREALKSALLITDWFAAPGQSINYMTCHDNLVLWDKLKISLPNADDATLIETMKLGYLVLLTSQGVPFFQGGEEFARTKGGNNNSYDAPDSVNQVDWSLKRKHLDLFHYTRDVIALRKAHPAFRLRTREEVAARLHFGDVPNARMLMYTLDAAGVPGETWKRVCVVVNADERASADFTLPEGRWSVGLYERCTSAASPVSGKVTVRRKSGLVLYQN